MIVGSIARQVVIQAIALTVDAARTSQCQVFHIGRQGVANAALDPVCTCRNLFGHAVRLIIHGVNVIAGTAPHEIDAAAAVQDVITILSEQRVAASTTVYSVIAFPGIDEVISRTQLYGIIAGLGEYLVIAAQCVDAVIGAGAIEDVSIGGAGKIEALVKQLPITQHRSIGKFKTVDDRIDIGVVRIEACDMNSLAA